MKTVVAFVGSPRRKHTYKAVEQFLSNLESLGDVKGEVVCLSDCQLGICRGCKLCIDEGSELCPLKDGRDELIDKMLAADGVIFASPVYSFQVSAVTKVFLDRLGFLFHRPRFFGKTFTSIVAQGFYGGPKTVKYLDFVGNMMGFNTVKGSCIVSLEPMTAKQQAETDKILARQSRRFYERLMNPVQPVPSLFKLMIFRMSRTAAHILADDTLRDHGYWRDQGWFESDYYYPTRLGVTKKMAGNLFDWMAANRLQTR